MPGREESFPPNESAAVAGPSGWADRHRLDQSSGTAAAMASDQLADVLTEFARTMLTAFPIQGILDHLVRRIVDIMPVSGAGVTLISPGLEPRYVAASDPSALRYEKLQSALGQGPCLAACHTGDAVAVADLAHDDRFPAFASQATKAGLAAVFTFPLNHEDMRLGALDLYRDTPGSTVGRVAQRSADPG